VVAFTSISGAAGHLMRGNLDRRVAIRIAVGGLIGVLLGSWLFSFLVDHTRLLGLILGLVFLAPSLGMIREGLRPGTRPEPECIGGTPPGHLLFGAGVGVLTGITGLGGGYALVPGLLYLFGAPVCVTMGTSLASMIPMAILGGGIKLLEGYVAVGPGLILAAGSIAGAQVGAQYFANLRYPDCASPTENPHKSERSIRVAGVPSCLSPKGRGQPAVGILPSNRKNVVLMPSRHWIGT